MKTTRPGHRRSDAHGCPAGPGSIIPSGHSPVDAHGGLAAEGQAPGWPWWFRCPTSSRQPGPPPASGQQLSDAQHRPAAGGAQTLYLRLRVEAPGVCGQDEGKHAQLHGDGNGLAPVAARSCVWSRSAEVVRQHLLSAP
jgi:hypothetical protein